ncbi:hypothetical protein PFISCL1PPCAC_18962, partial [Pristionchus fissidentatus]
RISESTVDGKVEEGREKEMENVENVFVSYESTYPPLKRTNAIRLPQSPPSKRMKEEEEDAIEQSSLLDLPNEILVRIFSFLPLLDRWKARVNKRLEGIEKENRGIVPELNIVTRQ